MPVKDSRMRLRDGRELAFCDIGDAGWPAVFFFHGAPMSRLHLSYLEDRFLTQRVRVVSPDRPGYGRSSPQPGRLLTDWPSDVEALADALAIDRFVVAGHSSGGPYAVVCAIRLPRRVTGMALFGGVTNMGWSGAWPGFSDVESSIMRAPDEAAAVTLCTELFGADGGGFHSASDFDFPEPDNALFADESAGPAIGAAVEEAFRQGVVGYAQDAFVQGRPWAFDPDDVAVPALIAHGELDHAVPRAHSEHTALLITGSTLEILPGHGHMTTLVELPAKVLDLWHL